MKGVLLLGIGLLAGMTLGLSAGAYAQPAPDLPSLGPDQPPDLTQVRVSEIPLAQQTDDEKRTAHTQDIILDNGVRRFGLRRSQVLFKPATVPTQHVGWNAPDQANWYHSNVFDLLINGKSVNVGQATFTILESGPRGVADFTLNNESGRFRCRFVVIPNSEVLFADFAIEPAVEVKTLALKLHNYPGGFAVPREGKRNRQVFLWEGHIDAQPQPYLLDAGINWWFFYQDAFLDKDIPENRQAAYGPSALVLPAGEVKQIKITVGDYEVPTEIEYAPDRRHFRLALLDYFGLGNKAALARFAKERHQIKTTLENMVFVPQRLRAAQARLPQITAQGLTGEAATGVPELRQLLSTLPAGDPWTVKPVSTEDRALELLDQYDKARWAVVKKERPGIGVLVMRGLHWRYWGLDEAGQALGKLLRESGVSHYAEYYWKGEDISYFPATWEEISRFDVIVFANVPFTVLGTQRAQALAEYLQAGGSILLLGGTHAFGQAGLDQPPLGPLLPVQPTRLFDLQRFDKYQAIVKVKDAPPWLSAAGVDWKSAPAALWHHQVQAAAGGKVWLEVGGKPFLLTGSAGAGRVAALCAPPYGEVGKEDRPFWVWKSWPVLLARLLLWLGRGEAPTLPSA